MDIEKLKYSRCPNCKRHGIPSFGKTGANRPYKVVCKYCGKAYRINVILDMMVKIAIPVSLAIIYWILKNKYMITIPFWILVVLIIIFRCLYEYFAPLEDIE